MTDDDPIDDRTDEALARLDPVGTDPAPPRGSPRHLAILEHAMSTPPLTTDRPAAGDHPVDPVGSAPRRARRRRWPLLAATGVAATLLAVVGVVALDSGGDRPRAAAAVTEAAGNTGAVTHLRGRLTTETADRTSTSTIDVAGDAYRVRFGAVDGEGEEVVTQIGDTTWRESDGVLGPPETVPEEERLAPFAASSEAVVRAALRGTEVEDLGRQRVRGVDADRYRIRLTAPARAALAALTPSEVAWFELEYPDDVTTVEVWVTDSLIHRIRVTSEQANDVVGSKGTITTVTTSDFSDFGADIRIVPPR